MIPANAAPIDTPMTVPLLAPAIVLGGFEVSAGGAGEEEVTGCEVFEGLAEEDVEGVEVRSGSINSLFPAFWYSTVRASSRWLL